MAREAGTVEFRDGRPLRCMACGGERFETEKTYFPRRFGFRFLYGWRGSVKHVCTACGFCHEFARPRGA